MVASMIVTSAAFSLFLDVGHFPAGGHFAVPTDDATAPERGETQKSDETHNNLRRIEEQISYR
jgi:hypothetical protein